MCSALADDVICSGFDTFCPVSDFLPADSVPDPHNLRLWLKINDKVKQDGSTSDMMWVPFSLCLHEQANPPTNRYSFQIPQLIEHVSGIMTLEEGDLLLTGTPEGVGPVKDGETLAAALESAEGKELLSWKGDAKGRKGGYSFKGE